MRFNRPMPMYRSVRHQQRAHQGAHRSASTLIELVVVIGLLSAVGLGMYANLLFGQKLSLRSHHLTRASQVAAQELEVLRTMDFSTISAPYSGTFIGSTDSLSELDTPTKTLQVTQVNANLKQAVVTITWKEQKKSRSVSYTTYISKQGLNQ